MAAIDELWAVLQRMHALNSCGLLAGYQGGLAEWDGTRTSWCGCPSHLDVRDGKLILQLAWRLELERQGYTWCISGDKRPFSAFPLNLFHSIHFSDWNNDPLDVFQEGCGIGLESSSGWLTLHHPVCAKKNWPHPSSITLAT